MQAVNIRPLERSDAQALLDFEVRERGWFESQIEARDPAFYSVPGFIEHMEAYLQAGAAGVWLPLVIVDAQATIVGRANLKNVDGAKGTAEVGYRIARHACGQGLATRALGRLIDEARERWGLSQLVAHVYEANTGSKRVLERCGFVADAQADTVPVHGECRYVLVL